LLVLFTRNCLVSLNEFELLKDALIFSGIDGLRRIGCDRHGRLLSSHGLIPNSIYGHRN